MATALAKIILHNQAQIGWYIRSDEQIEYQIAHGHNPKYISSVELPAKRVRYSSDLNAIVYNASHLIFAVPSPFLKDTIEGLDTNYKDKFIISAIKGIVPGENLTIAEYFNKVHNVSFDNIGIITGPCHAEEVALERMSYLTVAAKDKDQAELIAQNLRAHYIRANTVKDIYGIEYASVLKNIVAIASGICHGLGYGDNFQAVLISNAMQEMKRFLDKTYKSKRKMNSSPYLGDLLVTAYSQFSRNRLFGTMVGKGYSIKAAQLEMNMVAEGYYASRCIYEINQKHKVSMPIMEAVYNIVYRKYRP
ncbi:MAG: glycerol-3-phosphate dehydrogenase [Bacteroidales bacterium]|nr:glycerol-3-phosphate dehydrogenase [Bacteroidales bacterium]